MKVYETKGNQYNEHNGGGLKTGRPTVSPKKDTDDVSSLGAKYVYLSMIQKNGAEGERYKSIYMSAVIVRGQSWRGRQMRG